MPATTKMKDLRKGDCPLEPIVEVCDDTDDKEWVLGRLQPLLNLLPDSLLKPKAVTVTLPCTRRGLRDAVSVTVSEGEVDRSYFHLNIDVGGGLKSSDGIREGGCISGAQLDRLIRALQLVAAEADKLGLRTPRKISEVSIS